MYRDSHAHLHDLLLAGQGGLCSRSCSQHGDIENETLKIVNIRDSEMILPEVLPVNVSSSRHHASATQKGKRHRVCTMHVMYSTSTWSTPVRAPIPFRSGNADFLRMYTVPGASTRRRRSSAGCSHQDGPTWKAASDDCSRPKTAPVHLCLSPPGGTLEHRRVNFADTAPPKVSSFACIPT